MCLNLKSVTFLAFILLDFRPKNVITLVKVQEACFMCLTSVNTVLGTLGGKMCRICLVWWRRRVSDCFNPEWSMLSRPTYTDPRRETLRPAWAFGEDSAEMTHELSPV